MSFSRDKLKKMDSKVKVNPDDFINASESPIEERKVKKVKEELTSPRSISLTDKQVKMLDRQYKRFNMMLDIDDDKPELNRSELVKRMTTYMNSLEDQDLFDLLSSQER
ncbi:hypothetical protein HC723_11770 [Vibrio sp. S11_S32]|uniref:hypothetical protein n=1 Tax=Vibrio sp. S11_S32 TaxID=2720225 RepID=UPI00168146B7|nr:hypothetical protein [Vibrio sp. S11_S32]MBD1577110.1 hypothetical protein [Vibrio sp. S11_S32]